MNLPVSERIDVKASLATVANVNLQDNDANLLLTMVCEARKSKSFSESPRKVLLPDYIDSLVSEESKD